MSVDQLFSLDRKIETLVGDVNNLPTPPMVFAQINRVISDETTSAYDVAAILSEDPAISAKVLRLSNSPFYELSTPLTTVKQAIVVLGLSEVRIAVLSASLFSAFVGRAQDREFHEAFWRHSLAVAIAARLLIRIRDVAQYQEAETAFSAGLLHDIGKIVILCYAPGEHREVRQLQAARGVSDQVAETEVMGIDHTHVGAFLGRRWNLPPEIIEAISFHHRPEHATARSRYAAVVSQANFLAHTAFDPRNYSVPQAVSDPDGAELAEMEPLKTRLIDEYAKSETFLRMALG